MKLLETLTDRKKSTFAFLFFCFSILVGYQNCGQKFQSAGSLISKQNSNQLLIEDEDIGIAVSGTSPEITLGDTTSFLISLSKPRTSETTIHISAKQINSSDESKIETLIDLRPILIPANRVEFEVLVPTVLFEPTSERFHIEFTIQLNGPNGTNQTATARTIAIGKYEKIKYKVISPLGAISQSNKFIRFGDTEPDIYRAGFPDLKKLAVSTHTTNYGCAVTMDNKVICWGSNDSGQAGHSNLTGPWSSADLFEVPLPSPPQVVAIAKSHSCALTDGKAVYCWGDRRAYTGGSGPNANYTPTLYDHDKQILKLAVAERYTCILDENNEAYCRGAFKYNGSHFLQNQKLSHPLPITQLVATPFGPCGLDAEFKIVCWTDTSINGVSTIEKYQINWPEQPVHIQPTYDGLCAISVAKEIKCSALAGPLRPGQILFSVPYLEFGAITVETIHAFSTDCIIYGNNETVCRKNSVINNGRNRSYNLEPFDRKTPKNAVEILIGDGTTCYRIADGTSNCNNTFGNRTELVDLINKSKSYALSLSSQSFCAVTNSSELKCWNYLIQDKTTGVGLENVNGLPPLISIQSTSENKFLVLATDKKVYEVGAAGVILVQNLENVVVLKSFGSTHCAITESSELYCWGRHGSSPDQNGFLTRLDLPSKIENAGDVIDVAQVRDTRCIVRKNHSIFCHGRDQAVGLLGHENLALYESKDFLEIPVDTGALEITGTDSSTDSFCVVTQSFSVVCWGNAFGRSPKRIKSNDRFISVKSFLASGNDIRRLLRLKTSDGRIRFIGAPPKFPTNNSNSIFGLWKSIQ